LLMEFEEVGNSSLGRHVGAGAGGIHTLRPTTALRGRAPQHGNQQESKDAN